METMTARGSDENFLKNRKLPDFRPLEIAVPITVETTDLDYAGIVSNICYIRWLELMRNRFFAQFACPQSWMAQRTAAAVAETQIMYMRPLRFGAALNGLMWALEVRHVDARLGAAVIDDARNLCALAVQRVVTANWETMRPVRLPDTLLQAWQDLGQHQNEEE